MKKFGLDKPVEHATDPGNAKKTKGEKGGKAGGRGLKPGSTHESRSAAAVETTAPGAGPSPGPPAGSDGPAAPKPVWVLPGPAFTFMVKKAQTYSPKRCIDFQKHSEDPKKCKNAECGWDNLCANCGSPSHGMAECPTWDKKPGRL